MSLSKFAFNQKPDEATAKKVSPALYSLLEKKMHGSDSIELLISSSDLPLPRSFRLLEEHLPSKSFRIKIKNSDLNVFLKSSSILFVDVVVPAKEEVTTGSLDINTNKINTAHAEHSDINGLDVIVSVKENRFDTTDIDYKGRYINTGIASPNVTTHASIMATTIAGAANSSPFSKGVAPACYITSSNFANLFPDPDSLFLKYSISIQNHSYGTAVQNYYGIEASAYDLQMNNNLSLLHVFSSGNSGALASNSGTYSFINGYANLTGNFKQAKNILTVGATDSFYKIPALSSKGPAYDGRVKPEIVAFGEDGSSGAAAMVSGAAALIQQAYRKQKNLSPESALVKAILINSADKINYENLSYTSGYGSLNVLNAVKTITEHRFIEDSIERNQTKFFELIVPPNTEQLKITMVWNDPSAVVNSAKALVNDLNLKLISNSGESWLPWVLNHFPEQDSLIQAANRSIDTLNNIEHVTIEKPNEGVYNIEVKGSKLSTENQKYAIAYELEASEKFKWTFPTSQDQVKSNSVNILRWQTTKKGSATLYFSINGNTWESIQTIPDASLGYFKWDVPDTISTGLVKMVFDTVDHTSDTFVISKQTHLYTGFNCKDSFLLYWNSLPVSEYQLYQLEDKYLQPILLTNDTFAFLDKSLHPSTYYSVAPIVNNKPGLRSFILNYPFHGVDCYIKSFYLQSQSMKDASFYASIGSIFNVKKISFQKLQKENFITVRTIYEPANTNFIFSDSSLTRGVNFYRIEVLLQDGKIIFSNIISIFHFDENEIIVYPNPVQQNQPIQIITTKAGRIKLYIYTSSGIIIKQYNLDMLHQQIPSFNLSKGIYFIKAVTDEGKTFSQKLIVQ